MLSPDSRGSGGNFDNQACALHRIVLGWVVMDDLTVQRRRPLPTYVGWTLFAITLCAHSLNAGFFWWMQEGALLLFRRLLDGTWMVHSAYSFSLLDEVIPRAVVATPAIGLLVSAGCALAWPFRLHRSSRRTGMVWALALVGAIAGWPVACGCIAVEGYGTTGGMPRN